MMPLSHFFFREKIAKNFLWLSLMLSLFLFRSETLPAAPSHPPPPATPENKVLDILKFYEQGVQMNFTKIVYIKMLKKTRKSQGEITIFQQNMIVKIKDRLSTQLLFDGKTLKYITYPEGETNAPQVQLLPAAKMRTHLIFSFLHTKPFKQQFRFISSRKKGRTLLLHFKPQDPALDIQSLFLQIEGKRLLSLRIQWKALENEEKYRFSHIRKINHFKLPKYL